MLKLFLIIFSCLYIFGCSSGGSNSYQEPLNVTELLNTTWMSSECQIVGGWNTKYSITFKEDELVFHYKQCVDESETIAIIIRPVLYGDSVVTESGLLATQLTINTQFLPEDSSSDYKYDVIDYISSSNGVMYFASKDYLSSDCLNNIDVTNNTIRILFACIEWSPRLDFEFPFYKQI